MSNSFAEKIRRLEEKKARALETAKRDAARVEEAKQKLTEPLVRRFSGWTKSAIEGVIGTAEAPVARVPSTTSPEATMSRVDEQPRSPTA